ncbi:hypothetical protein [Pseudomonas congelans]|nr:hypothetical protein [Pseudomonas congelans]
MDDLEPGVTQHTRCKKGHGGEKPDDDLRSLYKAAGAGGLIE